MTNPITFAVGDHVRWKSHCPHGKRVHIGTVVRVLPAGTYPHNVYAERPPGLRYRGWWRPRESYIVVDARGRHWWPRVSLLRRVTS